MSTAEQESDLMEGLDPAERRLSLGHRLMMLGHLKTKFRQSREVLNRYRHQMLDGSLGPRETDESPLEGLDDMLVLGNVTVTNTVAEAAKTGESTPTQTPPAISEPSMLSKALPYVLTALATAGGLGGAGWLAGLFDQPEGPPAVEQPIDFPKPPGYGLSL